MTDRFPDATRALDLLPLPAVIKGIDEGAIRAARLSDFVARMRAKGVPYDVAAAAIDPGIQTTSEADAAVVLQEEGAYREALNLAAINDAARAVMFALARGADQDNLYPLVGVRRLTITPADPTATPPVAAVMEDDDAFCLRAMNAMEGLAPGLTGGGYAHIALRAAPAVRRVCLQRQAGGVVRVILQGRSTGAGRTTIAAGLDDTLTGTWVADASRPYDDGSVSPAAVRAVAAALNDDWTDDPATGSQLTDVPMVQSARVQAYEVAARATVPAGPGGATLVAASLAALVSTVQRLQLTGSQVPTDALIAAGRAPSMTKFVLDAPAADIVAEPDAVPWCRAITLTVRYA